MSKVAHLHKFKRNPTVPINQIIRDSQLNPLSFKQAKDLFLLQGRIENLSRITLDWYNSILKMFKEYLEERGQSSDPADIKALQVKEYICYLAEEKVPYSGKRRQNNLTGLSVTSVNSHIKGLKAFFNFLYQEGNIDSNPIKNIKKLRGRKKIIETFSESQLSDLLSQPNRKTLAGYRDYMIILTLIDTGLRISELLDIRKENLNLEDGVILVSGKGNKDRYVPIGFRLKKEMLKYLLILERMDTDFVFPTQDDARLNNRTAQKSIQKYGRAAGITNIRVSPHTFRHTFAKMYILNGGDPFSLQQILGHSTLDMVKHYVNMVNAEIRLQHNKHSPLDRIKIRSR